MLTRYGSEKGHMPREASLHDACLNCQNPFPSSISGKASRILDTNCACWILYAVVYLDIRAFSGAMAANFKRGSIHCSAILVSCRATAESLDTN
jgi:hypothetical protein